MKLIKTLGLMASIGAALAMSSAALAQQQFVNILTGGHGGVYYPLGVTLSQIFAKEIPNTHATALLTRGSVENLMLLQTGRGELGMTLADSLSDAWNGVEEAGFRGKQNKLRGLSAAYNNYIQIVANADSGIRSIADLKGKRVSVGAARSGTELNARALLRAAGVSYADLARIEYLPFVDSMELIKNRQLDATLISAGLDAAVVRDVAAAIRIVFVPIPADVVVKVGDSAYQPGVIPANTYSGQTQDVPTAAIPNFLVTHAGVSNDLAYHMTKAIYNNLLTVHASQAAAQGMSLINATKGMPVPLHPGAERFYRENGVLH